MFCSLSKKIMNDSLNILASIPCQGLDAEADLKRRKKSIEKLSIELTDKASYHTVVQRMIEQEQSLDTTLASEEMGWYLLTLMEAISCMSIEIYEHYRTLVDLLRKLIKGYLCAEEFDVDRMVQYTPRFAVLLGCVILRACDRKCLHAEKYEHIGHTLVNEVLKKYEERNEEV